MLLRAPHSVIKPQPQPSTSSVIHRIPVEFQRSKPKMFLLASSSSPSSLATNLVLHVDLYHSFRAPQKVFYFVSCFINLYWRGKLSIACSLINFMPDSILPMTC